MLRVLVAVLALAACAPTTQHTDALDMNPHAPLSGTWAIETIAAPDSGCTFAGEIVMVGRGSGNVQYLAAMDGLFSCPDGRQNRLMQGCDAYDLAVLLVNCTVLPEMATPDYPGDEFSMQRPLMQAPVEEMTGSMRLPEAEMERLRGADFIVPHMVRWRRISRGVPELRAPH